LAPEEGERVEFERGLMVQPAYELDAPRREAVLGALVEHCEHRGWLLLAAHVRVNHVHVVIEAEEKPERLMNALKAWASRALNALGIDGRDRRRWARHGSTRWLWSDDDVARAIRYVVDEQGEPMAVFVSRQVK
jgi:REP element-mobilizing transposase RayT